jgi:dynein heavy chain
VSQRKWLHLEGIFSSGGDVQKQMPEEYKVFDSLNEQYVLMMNDTRSDSRVSRLCSAELRDRLGGMDGELELIEKTLDEYLETKRRAFPRFYFISNDDLLQILGQSQDSTVVLRHLKKCFEGVSSLRMMATETGEKRKDEPLFDAALAPDGEALEFLAPLPFTGPIEKWFAWTLISMRCALSRCLLESMQGYRAKEMCNWVKAHQGQLLITTGAIAFNVSCTKALNAMSCGRDNRAMKTLKKKQSIHLRRLTALIGTATLTDMEIAKTVSLITVEIHNRDVMEQLIRQECKSTHDFSWLSQLRFHFNKSEGANGSCSVEQIHCSLPWYQEYQGNNGRLVITPLTDRCILTLTTAMFLHRGGNPMGPAGTGKTETVKDLAKALAQFCVVTNCSEEMDYKSAGKIFSGLCQSGSWGCFDEFNRIKIEVISVVAVQIKAILDAQRSKISELCFMGTNITCSKDAGFFITMNPGYAGRTELPDNLKSLMRPVAMMTPDLNLIAEATLASEGFAEARSLARKTVTLYVLMQQQLSKQQHYDYGLRSLKSVLCMAGAQKRSSENLPEEEVLVGALKVMNEAKFVNEDLALFRILLQDIFTECDAESVREQSSLGACVQGELVRLGLQKHPLIIDKIRQLGESQSFRHSNIIIGTAKTGKSTVWNTLAKAKSVNAAKTGDGVGQQVLSHVINPKSLSLTQLYGAYDLQTFEWREGVLSKIFKRCSDDDSCREKWIIFDGPVDAMWVENLNSTMDDNKILTLINGDRIPLSSSMQLLFEVGDLSVASPATVSRAGMIWIPSEMGWEPYVQSWIHKKFKNNERMKIVHTKLVDKFLRPLLHVKHTKCVEPFKTISQSCVRSLFSLYEVMVKTLSGIEDGIGDVTEDSGSFSDVALQKCFMFSLVWSVLSTVDKKSRSILDEALRDIDAAFPPLGTIFDYCYDSRKDEFQQWQSLVPAWKPQPRASFHSMFVPSFETVRNGFVVSTFIHAGQPMMLGGKSGIGKTKQIRSILSKMTHDFTSLTINFSATTSSDSVQETIESKLERQSRGKMKPSGRKKLIVFLDDFNLPQGTSTESPSQPPLELVRQFMDYNGWYDRKKCDFLQADKVELVAAMDTSRGGRGMICNRNLSNFCLLVGTEPESSQVVHIFQSIVSCKLRSGVQLDAKHLSETLSRATVEAYNAIVDAFPPTPHKLHYSFSMRDVARIIQGFLLGAEKLVQSREAALRLWLHESRRVFGDRCVTNEDEARLLNLVIATASSVFEVETSKVENYVKGTGQDPIYSALGTSEYVERSLEEARNVMETLVQPNKKSKYPDLIIFDDAVRHVCRIHRVLMKERGHLLLLGISGCGRRSLARLAALISDMHVISIKHSSKNGVLDFREDLKKLLHRSGVEGKPSLFLLDDAEVCDDRIYEYICSLICLGDVPNLFAKEDIICIRDALRRQANQAGFTREEDIWTFFIDRVCTNLHVVLTMNPSSEGFRLRCQTFPSLVSCTTIDWFRRWPETALVHVAREYIGRSDDVVGDEQSTVPNVFASMYAAAISSAEKVRKEQNQSVHTVPVNYVESVKAYLELVGRKQTQLMNERQKLSHGLKKLVDSKEQVQEMAKKLDKKKKIVDREQVECEKMMKELAVQKQDVEQQERLVKAESGKIGREEVECEKIAAEATADLDSALPALENALAQVDDLDKNKIFEVKSYKTPPKPVEKVMACVMIILGRPSDWVSAKKALGETDFLSNLKKVDVGAMSTQVLSKVSQFIKDKSFSAETISEKTSLAAGKSTKRVHLELERYSVLLLFFLYLGARYLFGSQVHSADGATLFTVVPTSFAM